MTLRRVLVTVDGVGGVWQYATDLSAGLRALGFEAILALLGPAPSAAQRADLDRATTLVVTGLELDWLAPNAGSVEAAGAAIATLAEDLEVDLVHLNQPALAACAPFSMPVITTIHSCVRTWWQAVYGGEEPASFAWQSELVRQGLGRSTAVTAPSRAFADAVRSAYLLDELPSVVPNGRRSLRMRQERRDDSVFTAGRLWDQGKNATMLDWVAARLQHPLRAAGAVQGPHGERIPLHHVELLGLLDEAMIATRLATHPIFVSAARYEPFGFAVLEAAAAGCALVLSDIPTFRENWDGAAQFVDPSDEKGFVAAIEALFADPSLRTSQEEKARDRAAHFTPARMAAGMAAIYVKALSDRDAALRSDAA